jgi:multidrug efflux pump subunit AcrA (membrane-fusion protein)
MSIAGVIAAALSLTRWWLIAIPLALAIAQPAAGQAPNLAAPDFTCLLEPKMVLKLGTPVPGLISEVLVDRGAIVKKGEVLARLDSGVEAAAVALAKARAENDATVEANRAKLDFQERKAERAMQLRKTENIAVSRPTCSWLSWT